MSQRLNEKQSEPQIDLTSYAKKSGDIVKPTIECTRVRACKWKGNNEDLVKKLNVKQTAKYGFECSDMICPKCGCKTTYNIPQE